MIIDILRKTVGLWKENTYLVKINEVSVLIDPGDEFEVLKKEFQLELPTIQLIILTHGHFDHLGACAEFQNEFGLPVWIHSKDRRIASQANLYRRLAGDTSIKATPVFNQFIDDLNAYNLGSEIIKFHHTPGHSKGSICLEIGNNLFCGDILLDSVIGRTDLPGGSKVEIIKSIEYIFNHFQGYHLHPGHGNSFVLTSEIIDRFKVQMQ